MSINWEKSPEGATHFHYGNVKYSAHWYKEGYFCVVGFEDKGWKQDFDPSPKDQYIERPTVKQWSGQQDGLPPVNTVCGIKRGMDWTIVTVVAHFSEMAVIAWTDDSGEHADLYSASELRPIRTPRQIAAEQRETAIREMIAICKDGASKEQFIPTEAHMARMMRYCFDKLVDAGFKREVV